MPRCAVVSRGDLLLQQQSSTDSEAAQTRPPTGTPEWLHLALTSREHIDQAKGILIALHRVSGETAWQMLSAASQHWNVKVRLVADALIALVSGTPSDDEQAARVARELLPPAWARDRGDRVTAADRRLLGEERDRLAAGRDAAAARRDAAAVSRDRSASRRDVVVGAAADRTAAKQDRRSAGIDRDLAADDRVSAQEAEDTQA